MINIAKNILNNNSQKDNNYTHFVNKIRIWKFNLSEIEFYLGNEISGFELYEYRTKKLEKDFIDEADIIALSNIKELTFNEFKKKNLKK